MIFAIRHLSMRRVTRSSVERIGRLYIAWIGYNPIREAGEDPIVALQILKELRQHHGGKKATPRTKR